ncbi:MAG: pyridoxamine 5'-phosphate oxidase family protein [Salinigranum sp.]
MEHVEFVYTVGMDEAEIERRLREARNGTLALAEGGKAYAIPISHVYRDGRLYLRLTENGHSEKLSYVETTEEACFLVYGSESPDDSWSVVVTGELGELVGEERARFDETTITEAFEPIRVFDESIDDVDVRIYELEAHEVTGRRTT